MWNGETIQKLKGKSEKRTIQEGKRGLYILQSCRIGEDSGQERKVRKREEPIF